MCRANRRHVLFSVCVADLASDVDKFGMGAWALGVGAVGAALAGILLVNSSLTLPKVGKASLEYLADADLLSTADGARDFSTNLGALHSCGGFIRKESCNLDRTVILRLIIRCVLDYIGKRYTNFILNVVGRLDGHGNTEAKIRLDKNNQTPLKL